MQHQTAINVIRKLSKQLTKESAASVLTAYAEENDLSPTQLEKLAQVYNMHKQLSHIESSEDRGTTCHQLDTQALTKAYATGSGKSAPSVEKIAAPTHDVRGVDLMRALQDEIAPMRKAAAEASVPINVVSDDCETWTLEQLKEATWDAKLDIHMAAENIVKLAKCTGTYLELAQAESDAKRISNPAIIDASMGWLEKYAAQLKLSRNVTRHVGPVKAAAFNITTPLSDGIVELAEAFTRYALLKRASRKEAMVRLGDIFDLDAVKTVDDPPNKREESPQDVEDSVVAIINGFKDEGDSAATADPTVTQATPTQPQEPPTVTPPADANDAWQKAKERAKEKTPQSKPSGDSEKATNQSYQWPSHSVGKGGGGKTVKEDTATGIPISQQARSIADLLSAAAKPVTSAADAVGTAAGKATQMVNHIATKGHVNKNQMKLDSDIADIRRSILIRRLAATDPVLRDLPLKDVLETYNAITEINPDAAANPRRVLLAIREAASYEGLTMDSQKTLGDVRGAAAKTEEVEANNRKRRYTP